MKKCSYCGRDNPAEAKRCFECGTPFHAVVEASVANPKPLADEVPVAVEAGYRWTAKDAWKCLGIMLVLQCVLEINLGGLSYRFPALRHLFRSPAGEVGFWVIPYYAVNLLTALYFARTDSFASFRKSFGFEKSPSSYVWFGVVCAVLIHWFGDVLISQGWAHGVHGSSIGAFHQSYRPDRFLYLLSPIVLAPLCEETYMRGFLYRAFRGSYSMFVSVVLVVIVTAGSHWWELRQTWLPWIDIPAITIVQCCLRERSGNLWDCVICHLVYNGTSIVGGLNRN